VTFSYGPGRQRWQQSYSGNGITETTDYVGGSLEIVSSGGVTDYRHYISAADGRAVAVYSRKSNGTNTFSYVLSDHENSVASIVNSSGASVVNESFTPFGSRRNPATWSGAASNADLTTAAGITREGYTFQTALGLWMGLNHMNGRVQDSVTGRFLSPDPHIPNRAITADYNRYSYVRNNPLSHIDPTGFNVLCTSGNCPDTTTSGSPFDIASDPFAECFGNCGGPSGSQTPASSTFTVSSPIPIAQPINFASDSSTSSDSSSDTASSDQDSGDQSSSDGMTSDSSLQGNQPTSEVTIIDVAAIQNFVVQMNPSSYYHIYAFHAWFPIPGKSRYLPPFRNVNSLNAIMTKTVNSTIGFPQPNGNYYFSADVGFAYGTDEADNPTSWNTVIVRPIQIPTETTPGVGVVVTMYPGQ
jgi:RHS repeat-associated protein